MMTVMRHVQITPGMSVIGADGRPIGTVGAIYLPSVVEPGCYRSAAEVEALVPVDQSPPPVVAQLVQGDPLNTGVPVAFGPTEGYLRVDRPEPLTPATLYIPLADVAWVTIDTIVLRETIDQLVARGWHLRPGGIAE